MGSLTNTTINMGLRQMTNNPTGSGSAYVFSRSAIRRSILNDFITLLREYRREFLATPYIYNDGNILFHVRVPSRDYKSNRIAYDVLYLLEKSDDRNMASWNTRVFCNSPSFIFDYAYVYDKYGLLFDKVKNRLPSECLTQPPSVRNPIESLGFERITQMAAHYLISGACLSETYIGKYGIALDREKEKALFSRLANPKTIVSVYQYAKYEKAKTHRKEMSAKERLRKETQKEKFRLERKAAKKAETSIFRSPRSKITARKAAKSLLNPGSKSGRVVAAKKSLTNKK